MGGALLGAWLGFHATQGLPALLTTIVGAIAGANLLLLVLDLSEDRQQRGWVAVATTAQAPQRQVDENATSKTPAGIA
jgi:hypothetical protein